MQLTVIAAEWGGQRRLVECCHGGRLLATSESTCRSRDMSRDEDGDDVGCAVVCDVCCLAELRQMRCRRGVSHGLTASTWQLHHDCQRLQHDDAKVRRALQMS